MAASSLLQCPDCSRIVRFSSDKTTIISCDSCGSVIWRGSNNEISVTAQFPILQKNDIIQPGTTGTWQNQRFTVLGRFRVWLEESVFNYWTIRFDDDKIAWLGEGYGLYSILENIPDPGGLEHRKLKDIPNGIRVDLKPDDPFMLRKKQLARKWEIEGELLALSRDTYLHIADFSSENGSHITVFEWGERNIHFYGVKYSSFEDLSLQNLREYSYSDKQFNCTKCSTAIHVKTFPYAQSCACPQCGTCYELANGMDFNRDSVKKPEGTIYLPLGSTGTIDNISYEVVGYAHKEERNIEKAQWSEFTLFNPREGFAFLSVFAGHWIYVREKGDSPVITGSSYQEIKYDNEPFHLYNSYTHKVIAAAGEFPYNIFDNEKSKSREFISPPEMWIEERSNAEGVSWYFAKHIRSNDVEKAFSVISMPAKSGIGALQPTGFINSQKLFMMTLYGILLLCIVHIAVNMSKQERVILDKTYSFPDSSNTAQVVTEKFHLDKWRSNLEFYVQAAVQNSWLELSATLVNTESGKEYSLEKGVEYYSGVSEGESWSEGGQSSTAYLTGIPPGDYFLQLQGSREPPVYGQTPINSFFVKVTYDVPAYRNLAWAIGLIIIWPIVIGYRSYKREQNRWFTGPFSTDN